ncbi:MAG: hypothetical protein BWX47_00640 [candidate division Hyd24-12 bacterium ADurb.Bin004]|nr:MAG: hypothetical protein BWX47_00640 [candidate division Hyd24-12 bacterium ADurb.Bin004]
MPMMMKRKFAMKNSDRATTTLVGPGRSPPRSENICAKIGMMKMSITEMTRARTIMTTMGYIMAVLILDLRLAAFSRWVASLDRIVSRMPPCSPAKTMLT